VRLLNRRFRPSAAPRPLLGGPRDGRGYCRAMPLRPDEVEVFERSRGRLEAIAYRLLGSASDAEDAVQDTFLRWQSADREHVETPEAWLTRVLTNLCLNQLTS